MGNDSLNELNELTKELCSKPTTVPMSVSGTVDEKLTAATSLIKDAQVTLISATEEIVVKDHEIVQLKEELATSTAEVTQGVVDKEKLARANELIRVAQETLTAAHAAIKNEEIAVLKEELKKAALDLKNAVDKIADLQL